MLPYSRSFVMDKAIKGGATHILTLDTDMTYPGDVAHRLVAHGRPFVAANATTRRLPAKWVAKDKAGEPLSSSGKKGLEKASVVGLAVALIETRVYRSMAPPRFNFEYTEKGWIGEDVWFCRRAIDAGFQPMIDHDLSHEIGHVGTWVFHGDDVET